MDTYICNSFHMDKIPVCRINTPSTSSSNIRDYYLICFRWMFQRTTSAGAMRSILTIRHILHIPFMLVCALISFMTFIKNPMTAHYTLDFVSRLIIKSNNLIPTTDGWVCSITVGSSSKENLKSSME